MKDLLANFPHCDDYVDDSFTGIWHEKSMIDFDKYWQFEKSLFDLASVGNNNDIPRDIAWPITRIFSFIMSSIQSHFDANDGFCITNLDGIAMYEFRERFQGVFEGFFSGNMPNNDDFEIINPLI